MTQKNATEKQMAKMGLVSWSASRRNPGYLCCRRDLWM